MYRCCSFKPLQWYRGGYAMGSTPLEKYFDIDGRDDMSIKNLFSSFTLHELLLYIYTI